MSWTLRRCRPDDAEAILAIVNAAAEAYRGVIPADCWHEPYMTAGAFQRELAAGVQFWAAVEGEQMIGVMGLQPVDDVDLIRHAYVAPSCQGRGVGGEMLEFLRSRSGRRILVGTWAAAEWAIRFYERHGFDLVEPGPARELLGRYWTITPRQTEVSVVLEA